MKISGLPSPSVSATDGEDAIGCPSVPAGKLPTLVPWARCGATTLLPRVPTTWSCWPPRLAPGGELSGTADTGCDHTSLGETAAWAAGADMAVIATGAAVSAMAAAA